MMKKLRQGILLLLTLICFLGVIPVHADTTPTITSSSLSTSSVSSSTAEDNYAFTDDLPSSNTDSNHQTVVDKLHLLDKGFKHKVIEQNVKFQTYNLKPRISIITVSKVGDVDTAGDNALDNMPYHGGEGLSGPANGIVIVFAKQDATGAKNKVRISYGKDLPDISSNYCVNLLEKNKSLLKSSHRKDVQKGLQNVYNTLQQYVLNHYAKPTKAILKARHQKAVFVASIPFGLLLVAFIPLLIKPLLWLKKLLFPVRNDSMFDDDIIFFKPVYKGNHQPTHYINHTSSSGGSGGGGGGGGSAGGGGSI